MLKWCLSQRVVETSFTYSYSSRSSKQLFGMLYFSFSFFILFGQEETCSHTGGIFLNLSYVKKMRIVD